MNKFVQRRLKKKEIYLRNVEDPEKLERILESRQAEMESFRQNNVADEISQGERNEWLRRREAIEIGGRWVHTEKQLSEDKVLEIGLDVLEKGRYVLRGDQDSRSQINTSPTPNQYAIRVYLYTALATDPVTADFKTAFLNTKFDPEQTRIITPALDDQGNVKPKSYWLLNSSVYGLRDAPRQWWKLLSSTLKAQGYHRLVECACIFVNHKEKVSMCLYVDDALAAGKGDPAKAILNLKFKMSKNPESVYGQKFVGPTLERHKYGVFLSLKKYLEDHLPSSIDPLNHNKDKNPQTPIEIRYTPSDQVDESDLLTRKTDVTKYRSMAGLIGYIAGINRPDLAYAAHVLSLSMTSPTRQSLKVAFRAVRYVEQTRSYGIVIPVPREGDVLLSFCDAGLRHKRGHTGFILGILRKSESQVPCEEGMSKFLFFPLWWRSVKQVGTVYSSMHAELNALHTSSSSLCHVARMLIELSMNMTLYQFTDSRNTNDKVEDPAAPRDLDMIPSLQHLRERLVKNNIHQCKIPRNLLLADSMTASRSMDMILPVVNGSCEIKLPNNIRSVCIDDFMLVKSSCFSAALGQDRSSQSVMPLCLDLFSGVGSATQVLKRYFNVISLDIDPKFSPSICVDIRTWKFERDIESMCQQGLGWPKLVFIASPCNVFSLMRYQPGRRPPSEAELKEAREIVLATVKILVYIQKGLRARFGNKAELLVIWENPSSAGRLGLMAWLRDNNVFVLLESEGMLLQVLETSQCFFGFPYSKPTHLAVSCALEVSHVLPPPCRAYTRFGCCAHVVSHVDVRKIDRELAYRLPAPLIEILANAARKVIERS